MASPNLDLVRSIYAAWEHGDFSSADWADPEIEYAAADGPEPDSWAGRGRMAEVFLGRVGPWEEFRIGAEEYRELEGGRVLVLDHRSGRGKVSGIELTTQAAHVFHVRDGRVIRFVNYWDRERAFADLGLSPEGDIP